MYKSANFSRPVICLSHLRWDFVYQRPQHLLSRFAKKSNVYFFEEPIFSDEETRLDVSRREDNLLVLVPHISNDGRENSTEIQREMLDKFIESEKIEDFVLWFYTPMAMDYAAHLKSAITIFDCMDELSAFKFAPPELIENERKLLEKADIVFTGGQSLYEAKKTNIREFSHFRQALTLNISGKREQFPKRPEEQRNIPLPRFGFCGVIDERMDIDLLGKLADLRPTWQFVMIGPVVKIADEDLPRRENIHYLGGKNYQDLPAFLSGWDVAMMTFAMNESTKFISPTKTPEYLAAGKPVISTPIRDVVRPYGEQNLLEIASTAEEFAAAGDKLLQMEKTEWLGRVDEFLTQISWDKTWNEMTRLIEETIGEKPKAASQKV